MSSSISVAFGLVDVSAKKDTISEFNDKQDFINPQDLSLEGVFAPKVCTLEKDYWKLDGTFKTFPDNPEDITWGIWSKSMTLENGVFEVPPILILNYKENHSSIGLTFEFNPYGNDYCNNLNIKWYKDTNILSEQNFNPDNWRFSCMNKVENYNRIIITFNSMNRGYRYLKIQNIMHGVIKTFDSIDIKDAKLLEEIDLTSAQLSINTFDFIVYSDSDDFNIFNPKGVYNLLQKKQQISVDGNINGNIKSLGTFYLDKWESQGNRLMSIKTVDGIGVMDGTYFKGDIYFDISAKDLIEIIMNDAGFGYSLDNSLKDIQLSGWIPKCTHREALQQVAFAIGGYVDTSRSGAIAIRQQPDIKNMNPVVIDMNRKFIGTKVKLKTYVTGVSVTEHNYILSSDVKELFNGELDVGDNIISFSSPSADLTVTGGNIVEKSANYCIISVSEKGNVILRGKNYDDNTKIITKKIENLPAGEKENIIEVQSATLVTSTNSFNVAERFFNYYQNRIEQNISFVVENETVGARASIEVEKGNFKDTVIERLETNLTGGFVTKAVVVGAQ